MTKKFPALLAVLLILSAQVTAAATAVDVHGNVVAAVTAETSAQRSFREWEDSREILAAEIRDMKALEAWLDFQNEKYARYVRRQHDVIAELERRKEEARRIRMELEPFLETVVESLERFVETDLPFLEQERRDRIAFLRESLDDYRLELSEKLRRVFEALLVEAEYGRTVSASTEELDIDGHATLVTVFRLGRTALFYQTGDGRRSGVWDRTARTWTALDTRYAKTLSRARDMAERKRAVELLVLPVGGAR